jgi:hypothetical protein
MDYSEKIKQLQAKAGVEETGVASSKTWLAIYNLLCTTLPYDINLSSIIKLIQERINVRVTGSPSPKTWDALHALLVGDQTEIKDNTAPDPVNEVFLQQLTKEVVPFAKELIRLAAEKGIYIRLMNFLAEDDVNYNKNANTDSACDHNFGLVFNVGIYECDSAGVYHYKENCALYEEVAKLGESIGLTWARDRKTFSKCQFFELRPAWAVRMQEMEMIDELCRRKKANINLLAIL